MSQSSFGGHCCFSAASTLKTCHFSKMVYFFFHLFLLFLHLIIKEEYKNIFHNIIYFIYIFKQIILNINTKKYELNNHLFKCNR